MTVEFSTSFKVSLKNWNMAVQSWLERYIFKRSPVRSLSKYITFFASAFWHGFYPGYYITFFSVLVFENAGIAFFAAAKRVLGVAIDVDPKTASTPARFVSWFAQWALLLVSLTYAGASFQLFDVDSAPVYAYLSWFGHVSAVAAWVIAMLLDAAVPPKRAEKSAADAPSAAAAAPSGEAKVKKARGQTPTNKKA